MICCIKLFYEQHNRHAHVMNIITKNKNEWLLSHCNWQFDRRMFYVRVITSVVIFAVSNPCMNKSNNKTNKQKKHCYWTSIIKRASVLIDLLNKWFFVTFEMIWWILYCHIQMKRNHLQQFNFIWILVKTFETLCVWI